MPTKMIAASVGGILLPSPAHVCRDRGEHELAKVRRRRHRLRAPPDRAGAG
jgi:hypothetical protein